MLVCNGYLKDIDVRWNQLTDSMDDRSKSEHKHVMPRCFANNLYLADDARLPAHYQRNGLHVNQDLQKQLVDGGLPPSLATHFALSFNRDPLAISEADLSDCARADSTLAFDILDGCDWPHVKLKLPSTTNNALSWRVEFRSTETQFTDFENAAFCIFVCLVKSAIVKYRLNLYAPIANVQENMPRTHARDAVLEERFLFRRDPFGQGGGEEDLVMLSVHDIVNGNRSYVGLVPLIERYMHDEGWSDNETTRIKGYLDLVGRRASGAY